MKIDKRLYERFYELGYLPDWTCSQCKSGKLVSPEKGIKTFEYKSSKDEHENDGWEPEWIRGNFVGILNCSNSKCKCTTVISGGMFVEQAVVSMDEPPYHTMEATEHIVPNYFNPPLEIIPIHDYYKPQIIDCLKESFKVFWNDSSGCANKIRITVEAIMNEQKIAKTTKNKKGERVQIKLHQRLEIFEKSNPDVAELLFAIKWIGNEGSHDLEGLERNDIITAYEILHQALERLYNDHPVKVLKMAKRINKNRGVKKGRAKK
jgi:Domain of unknown function (DUF4145)